jgi:hypothetical protein
MNTSSLRLASFTPKETRFGLVMVFFALMAFVLPPYAQPQDYHHFADERSMFGIARSMDVLSNLGFLIAGLWGLRALSYQKNILDTSLAWSLRALFWGVLLTGVGSAYYHYAPQDARLVWDRLPMTIAFAGICGALGSTRVSPKAGLIALTASLIYGLGSIFIWRETGNLTPYAVMQFGGMAWIATAWVGGKKQAVDLPWGTLLCFYIAAKFFETFDAAVYAATSELLSGHTIKHLLSALAAASFAYALSNRRQT